MSHYVVQYMDDGGYTVYSQVVERFDSLNELSAKTLALDLLQKGFTHVKICEVRLQPIYEIHDAPPGIGPECRMRKIEKFQGEF